MEQTVVETDRDRYLLVEHLAVGGMGAIYRGKKVGVGGSEKDVVLKQLLPEFTSHPEFVGLFLREARLSASLDHANIVKTIDLVAFGDRYYMVMEYVCGADLRTVLRLAKRIDRGLSSAACLFIAREILNALAYAHSRNSAAGEPLHLIHRDISPANIMLSASGEVKLADFGIAKISTHNSVYYRVKGKAGYMSPEQTTGDAPLDHRSDLYSLGVCLFEMLSGSRLFVVDPRTSPSVAFEHPVPELEQLHGMPVGIDAILRKALDKLPEHRYQSALEFQEALIRVADANGLPFTGSDLEAELKQLLGDSPSDWRVDGKPPLELAETDVFVRAAASAAVRGDSQLSSLLVDASPDAPVSVADPVETASVRLRPNGGNGDEDEFTRIRAMQSALCATGDARVLRLQQQTNGRMDVHSPMSAAAEHSEVLLPKRPSRTQRKLTAAAALLFTAAAVMIAVELFDAARTHGSHAMTVNTSTHPFAGQNATAPPLRSSVAARAAARPEASGTGRRARPRHANERARNDSADAGPAPVGTTLRVKSRPPGGIVYVDGQHRCISPCTVDSVDPSRITLVRVQRNGYRSWSALVDPRRQRHEPVHARLSRERPPHSVGYLVLRSSPSANVLVNGKSIGRVTSEGRIALRPGVYRIALSRPGQHHTVQFRVIIRRAETVTRKIQLE